MSNIIPASIQIGVAWAAQAGYANVSVNGKNPFLSQINITGLPQANVNFGGGAQGNAGGVATTPGAFSLPGIDTASWDKAYAQISQIGKSLDGMQDEAMKLMSSKSAEDRAKGQMMMQQFQQITEAIIKAIQIAGELAKSAIQSSKA